MARLIALDTQVPGRLRPAGHARALTAPGSAADLEADARRRTVRRAMLIGLWVWPSFIVVDAWMSFVVIPGAPFGEIVLYRVLVEAMIVATFRAGGRPGVRLEQLAAAQNVAFAAAAVAIALMAVSLGGVRSSYMHGISMVALVRAVLIPESWRQAWPHFTAVGLAFPVVMAVGAAVSPAARAEWLARDALIAFASNYIFVVASAVLGMVGSNMVWQARQQLYRARRVGRYRLQAPIGTGGMGEVWLAWDQSLQRDVALKLLRVSAGGGTDAVARFEREALAASRLQSPHVIQIFDYGASEDGLYYIAMEYLTGRDLQTLVEKEGPLPPARAIHMMMQACLALEVAHGAGVIHRDIKPHNLFVTRVDDDPDFVKLLDFGIVRLRESRGADLTWTGMLVGTPVYLAPELWQGHPADERSDLYALGMTLYFILTGREPGAGAHPAVAGAGIAAAPRLLDGESPLHRGLETLVRRCLAADPAQRVQTARALCAELARLRALA